MPNSHKGEKSRRGAGTQKSEPKERATFCEDIAQDERSAVAQLRKLDRGIERLYNRIVCTHTMADSGIVPKDELGRKIEVIEEMGSATIEQLYAFIGTVERTVALAKEHLLAHLAKEDENGKSGCS